jgi:hypothetical protein
VAEVGRGHGEVEPNGPLTAPVFLPILPGMAWERYLGRAERLEETLGRWREECALPARSPDPSAAASVEADLRLFPIVGGDLCYPVASLLARGRVEDAGRLAPDRSWVASTPLYG